MQTTANSFERLCQNIKDKDPNAKLDLVKKAFEFASHVHKNQKTPRGQPRIDHLVNTAKIISHIDPDEETLVAALLHDATLTGGVEMEELEREFGKEVSTLVEEYVKEINIEDKNIDNVDFELLSQIVLASAKDIRSLFIKMTAAISYLKEGEYLDDKLDKKKALLALNVYAPICHKLGLRELEWRAEDLAFKHLHRAEYEEIRDLVDELRKDREERLEKTRVEIENALETKKISAVIESRVKHYYSIYKKRKIKNFSEMYDLLGIRILCDSEADCYKTLGIINANYKIVEPKFRDYIADPKKNQYKSIHTVILAGGKPIEVQIRTWQMHWNDEVGLAAHWQYKDHKKDKYFDKKLSTIKQLREWHKSQKNSNELKQSLKTHSGEERIFVFTPKEEVVIIKEASTPIDFAFAIHSDVGFRAKGAKVNGKIVPLDHKLENGDSVEIITARSNQIKRQWLSMVKTDKAKSKIRQTLGIRETKKSKNKHPKGRKTTDLRVRMANCCLPLPGDDIIGYRTTKRKITVHRENCPNIAKIETTRKVFVTWANEQKNYAVAIKVVAKEHASLIPNILKILTDNNIVVETTHAKTNKNQITTCMFSARIKSKDQLEKAKQKIVSLPQVLNVNRE